MDKTPIAARQLISNMVANYQQFGTRVVSPSRATASEVSISMVADINCKLRWLMHALKLWWFFCWYIFSNAYILLLLLLNDKTNKMWTPKIISMAWKFIFCYIFVYCHFIYMCSGVGMGVPLRFFIYGEFPKETNSGEHATKSWIC